MAKTSNQFTPDQFEVEITVSAGDVTAIAAFTTAEAIDISGAVIDFKEVTTPEREFSEVYVAGDTSAVLTVSDKKNAAVYEMTLVDDYHKGSAGEWGTDLLSAVEIFQEYMDALRAISDLAVTPAGGTTGMIQWTLANVHILSVSEPENMSSANSPATVKVRMACADKTKAAHA